MSNFEITGAITKVENLTSSKGNAYLSFQVKDAGGKVFEMSLFGDSMSHAEKLKLNARVTVKGVLDSREYKDKNGKTRYGLELKPSWLEPAKTLPQRTEAPADDFGLDSIPF